MSLEQVSKRKRIEGGGKGDVGDPRQLKKHRPLDTEKIFHSDAQHRKELDTQHRKELKESYEDIIAEGEMPHRRELAAIWNKQLNAGIDTTELRKYYSNDTDRPLHTERHLQRNSPLASGRVGSGFLT